MEVLQKRRMCQNKSQAKQVNFVECAYLLQKGYKMLVENFHRLRLDGCATIVRDVKSK